jgi:hypothetical protein
MQYIKLRTSYIPLQPEYFPQHTVSVYDVSEENTNTEGEESTRLEALVYNNPCPVNITNNTNF